MTDYAPSIAAAIRVMEDQREKGIAKYGVPVEKANLPASSWLRHLQEEIADAAVYATKLDNVLSIVAQGVRMVLENLEYNPNVDQDSITILKEIDATLVAQQSSKQQELDLQETRYFDDGTMLILVNGKAERRKHDDKKLPVLNDGEYLVINSGGMEIHNHDLVA